MFTVTQFNPKINAYELPMTYSKKDGCFNLASGCDLLEMVEILLQTVRQFLCLLYYLSDLGVQGCKKVLYITDTHSFKLINLDVMAREKANEVDQLLLYCRILKLYMIRSTIKSVIEQGGVFILSKITSRTELKIHMVSGVSCDC